MVTLSDSGDSISKRLRTVPPQHQALML